MSEKRTVAKRKGMQAKDLALAGVLLAVGYVLRQFVPQMGFITPNFVIAMYCLAIYLIRPKFLEVLGISLVAAGLCQLTSKSPVPYLNFISEPVGAMVTMALIAIPISFSFKKKKNSLQNNSMHGAETEEFSEGSLLASGAQESYSLKPAIVTFFGTIASGLTYISLMTAILFIKEQAAKPFTVMLITVLATAVCNTIIAQLLYYPIEMAFRGKSYRTIKLDVGA